MFSLTDPYSCDAPFHFHVKKIPIPIIGSSFSPSWWKQFTLLMLFFWEKFPTVGQCAVWYLPAKRAIPPDLALGPLPILNSLTRRKCGYNVALRPSDGYMPQWSHYSNQYWIIAYWTLRKKFQWKLNRNSYMFIKENLFGNAVWKMETCYSTSMC